MRRRNNKLPVTRDEIKESATWTFAQVRRVMIMQAVVGLILAALAGFGTYWYASYVDIANRIETRLPKLDEKIDRWTIVAAPIFSDANPNLSENPELPSIEDVREIQQVVTALISELNSVPTPTASIEETNTAFRARLTEVIREIGRYDATAEATTRIVEASQLAADVGKAHRNSLDDYLNSAFDRLFSAL